MSNLMKRKASTSAAGPDPKRSRPGVITRSGPGKAAPASKKAKGATKKGKKETKGSKGAKGKQAKKDDGDGDDGDDSSDDDIPHQPPPNDRRQDTTTGFPIKRILAQRQINGRTEYLVDWLPTWTSRKTASGGKNEVISEWDALKTANETIQAGTTVRLKIENTTNDDSPPQIRRMIDEVLKMYLAYMSRSPIDVAADLFLDDEWQYLGTIQEKTAKKIARNDNTHEDHDPSAAEILRRAFREQAINRTSGGNNTGRYSKIRLQWLGNIDANAPPHDGQPPPPGQTVEEWLAPLFRAELWNPDCMRVRNWDPEETSWLAGVLRNCAFRLVREAPYILTKRWLLMFISMFFEIDELRKIIVRTALHFQIFPLPPDPEADDDGDNAAPIDDWENRVRDNFIYAYMDGRAWEKRTMESVNVTFVACQVWLQSEVDSFNVKAKAGDYRGRGLPESIPQDSD